jgi:hypothetical protein
MQRQKDDFLHWVQMHERAWGDEQYWERPSLEALLRARVVTFWKPVKQDKHLRYRIRIYESTHEVERYMTRLAFRLSVQTPDEKLSRIYVNRRRVVVKAVRILFSEVEEG